MKFIAKDDWSVGYPYVSSHPGWNTQTIRKANNIPKHHHTDACCVGYGHIEVIMKTDVFVDIRCRGYRNRQYMKNNKYGFPIGFPKPKDKRYNTETIRINNR